MTVRRFQMTVFQELWLKAVEFINGKRFLQVLKSYEKDESSQISSDCVSRTRTKNC